MKYYTAIKKNSRKAVKNNEENILKCVKKKQLQHIIWKCGDKYWKTKQEEIIIVA